MFIHLPNPDNEVAMPDNQINEGETELLYCYIGQCGPMKPRHGTAWHAILCYHTALTAATNVLLLSAFVALNPPAGRTASNSNQFVSTDINSMQGGQKTGLLLLIHTIIGLTNL